MSETIQADSGQYWITAHALRRMGARRISEAALVAALRFGRIAYVRGAKIFALGRKEVERLQRSGLDLSDYDGVQVVCTSDGTVLTTYRNRDFRGLRPCSSRHRRRRSRC